MDQAYVCQIFQNERLTFSVRLCLPLDCIRIGLGLDRDRQLPFWLVLVLPCHQVYACSMYRSLGISARRNEL